MTSPRDCPHRRRAMPRRLALATFSWVGARTARTSRSSTSRAGSYSTPSSPQARVNAYRAYLLPWPSTGWGPQGQTGRGQRCASLLAPSPPGTPVTRRRPVLPLRDRPSPHGGRDRRCAPGEPREGMGDLPWKTGRNSYGWVVQNARKDRLARVTLWRTSGHSELRGDLRGRRPSRRRASGREAGRPDRRARARR